MLLNPGTGLAIFSFFLWGITPLFYQLLPNASALELFTQRLLWSLPLLLLIRHFWRGHTQWRDVWQDKRSLLCCLLATLVMTCSWTAFVYSLTHGQVLAASLGYFINPLLSILFGALFLREHLTRYQSVAVLFAFFGLAYQIWQYGEVPVLALIMGSAFAFYGLIRKFIRFDIMTALTLETLWLYPIAIAITIWLFFRQESVLIGSDSLTLFYYALSAPITLLPLLFFAAAVKRTTLIVIGLSQYIEPTLQFLLAIYLFHEPFDSVKGISFSLIWIGLIICILSAFYDAKRQRNGL